MAEVRVATTLDEALGLLAADRAARPLAAGVGVLLGRALSSGGLGSRLPPAGRWIDVGRLPELAGIREAPGGRCYLGATVTIADLAEAAEVPMLVRAAAEAVGNPGVRAAATLGGNLVAMGPSSDLLAALSALGAVALADGPNGERRVPVARVPHIAGLGRPPGEGSPWLLLRGVELGGAEPAGWGFERLTFQGAMDEAAACVAVSIRAAGRGAGRPPSSRVRIVATAIAGHAVRFAEAERRLAVDPAIPATEIEKAASADIAAVVLREDRRVSAWYRRAIVPVLVRRAVESARAGPR